MSFGLPRDKAIKSKGSGVERESILGVEYLEGSYPTRASLIILQPEHTGRLPLYGNTGDLGHLAEVHPPLARVIMQGARRFLVSCRSGPPGTESNLSRRDQEAELESTRTPSQAQAQAQADAEPKTN